MMRRAFFAGLLVDLTLYSLFCTGAFAQSNDSTYTKIDLNNECSVIHADDFGATFACPGYRGIPVMVAEGDLRMFVSFGLNSLHEPAASQTLAPFNTIGETLEWRLSNQANGWAPIATILRYFTESGDGDNGQVLVVTKIKQNETCQVAQIDALKFKEANEIARDIADNIAPDFNCANQPIVWQE